MHPDVVEMYNWVGLGLKGPEAATVFTQLLMLEQHRKMVPSLPYCGPLVANTGLSFAFALGFTEIYLFGVDNGYIQGKTHSEKSIYNTIDKYSNGTKRKANIKLKGNLHQDVISTNILALAKKQMDSLLKTNKKIAVYNVGDGAFIEGALPLENDDVFISKSTISKTEIVQRVKQDYFQRFNLSVDIKNVAIDLFEEICNNLNEIARENFSSRKEASDLLKRQVRYLYAFRRTRFAHLFHMIKGSLLYYHCPMITVLYKYEDETESLHCFSELLLLWVDYIEQMKSDFRVNWSKKCDYDMALHLSLRQ